MRLDKYLCDCLGYTRSEVKKIISSGKVSLNGTVVKKADIKVNENSDTVSYNDKDVVYEKLVYYMLNKPAGIVSANSDNVNGTVIDLFKSEGRKNLSCVGRLDKDTTGLLLITDDGDLIHKLTSPSKHVYKDYLVGLLHDISDSAMNELENGVDIGDDSPTLPANVKRTGEKEIILSIREGRFHQVKRMLKAVDNEVVSLHRLSVGNVILDKTLLPGEYRRLTDAEINALKDV